MIRQIETRRRNRTLISHNGHVYKYPRPDIVRYLPLCYLFWKKIYMLYILTRYIVVWPRYITFNVSQRIMQCVMQLHQNITISTKMFTVTDALRNFIQTTCYIRRIRGIQTVFKSLGNDNVVNARTR